MTDDTEPATDHDSAAAVGHDLAAERTTAPMSEYASTEVAVGFAIFLVGAVIAFGIPLLAFPL